VVTARPRGLSVQVFGSPYAGGDQRYRATGDKQRSRQHDANETPLLPTLVSILDRWMDQPFAADSHGVGQLNISGGNRTHSTHSHLSAWQIAFDWI